MEPFWLGQHEINPPLLLAPMAGHSHVGFRTLVRELGCCGLVCSELISSHALEINPKSRKTKELFDWSDKERPFAVQLFGAIPEEMARAAQIVVARGAPIVDINMGCWVPKVAKKGCGAALLDDLPRAEAVVQAVVQAVEVPVTVKIRIGFEPGLPTALEFARAASKAGVELITVHGRYARQGFKGDCDHSLAAAIRAELPARTKVVANGDIVDLETARAVLRQTGCDGLMLGREALRRPWLFQDLARGMCSGTWAAGPSPDPVRIARRHLELTRELVDKPEKVLVRELRGQLLPYRLGAPLDHREPSRTAAEEELRQALVKVSCFDELEQLLERAADVCKTSSGH